MGLNQSGKSPSGSQLKGKKSESVWCALNLGSESFVLETIPQLSVLSLTGLDGLDGLQILV